MSAEIVVKVVCEVPF